MCLLTSTLPILGGAVTSTLIGHDTMNIIILLRLLRLLTKVALTQFDILLSMSQLANSQLKLTALWLVIEESRVWTVSNCMAQPWWVKTTLTLTWVPPSSFISKQDELTQWILLILYDNTMNKIYCFVPLQ